MRLHAVEKRHLARRRFVNANATRLLGTLELAGWVDIKGVGETLAAPHHISFPIMQLPHEASANHLRWDDNSEQQVTPVTNVLTE